MEIKGYDGEIIVRDWKLHRQLSPEAVSRLEKLIRCAFAEGYPPAWETAKILMGSILASNGNHLPTPNLGDYAQIYNAIDDEVCHHHWQPWLRSRLG